MQQTGTKLIAVAVRAASKPDRDRRTTTYQ